MKNPFYTLLALVLRLVLTRPVVFGLENVSRASPAIFISNHEGFFAPVHLMLFANQNFVPWVVYENFDVRLCREYIRKDFVQPTLHLKHPWSNIVAALIGPICVGLMKHVDAVPVYRSTRSIIETVDRSIDELSHGRNLLIFPEDPKDKDAPHIRSFQTGFVHLAKLLYEKNRQVVQFYPVYVNRHTRQIRIGRKIMFNPAVPFQQERTRILATLRERMDAMRTASDLPSMDPDNCPGKPEMPSMEPEAIKKPEK